MSAAKPPADVPFDVEACIDAAAPMLGLSISPAQRPGVALHLATTMRIVSVFMSVELPDDAELAPVFGA